jgi:hypothetical protein
MSTFIYPRRISCILCSTLALACLSVQTHAANLLGHEIPAYLEFSDPVYSVSEDQESAVITVVRTGEFREPVSVHYATGDGTAQAGRDYASTSGMLVIPAGVGIAEFSVPILSGPVLAGTQTVLLTLTQASPNAILTRAQAVLNVWRATEASAVAPALTVRPDGQGGIILSWPGPVASSMLEKSGRAAGGVWSVVSRPPEVVDGCCRVIEPASEDQFFYRLRVP